MTESDIYVLTDNDDLAFASRSRTRSCHYFGNSWAGFPTRLSLLLTYFVAVDLASSRTLLASSIVLNIPSTDFNCPPFDIAEIAKGYIRFLKILKDAKGQELKVSLF